MATELPRILLTLPPAMLAAIETWQHVNQVPNRSEAIRLLIAASLSKNPNQNKAK